MYYDYYKAYQLKEEDYTVKQLIMAAMFRSNVPRLISLKQAFPLIYKEWRARMQSPDGFITEQERTTYGDPGEPE